MPQLVVSSYIIMMILLMYPIIPTTTKKNWLLLIKTTTLTSLIPLLNYMNSQKEFFISINWWFTTNMDIKIDMMMDKYAIIFIPIALTVSWSILEFSAWYMNSDPKINQFFKYLMIFLFSMIILISSNNMFQFLIGWEGVGIMSFFLINWWFSRHEANTSALQAVVYNRIGDLGLIITTTWMAMCSSTWDMQLNFMELNKPDIIMTLGLLLAATGKSAQFGLHPWLPAAMEGPTPVSALLHSSTMVVAGVFLMIRMGPLLELTQMTLNISLCLGAISTLFSALCATTQNDIKKIIAFSTSSQLGLMMVAVGLNMPELAFFHICTHAFFKALLFLCSGTVIHTINNQDIRKMGGLQKLLPTTTSCMTTGNLALMGTPFLSGFYSKDILIEATCNSHLNAWALLLTLIATMLTASYTIRMIILTQTKHPRYPTTQNPDETKTSMKNPLLRLTTGSMATGLVLTQFMYTKTLTHTMPTITKLGALIVTGLGLILATDLVNKTSKLTHPTKLTQLNFSVQLGFFNTTTHRTTPMIILASSQKSSTQTMDQLWLEMLPTLTQKKQIPAIQKTALAQKGDIKTFLMAFITTTALTMLVILLNYT
uniref:NADH-ubiquinone oxidoreductase chain 5 n=1 Tax=Iphisa elegans TaxID=88863 RepID=A0A6M8Y6K6_IPHEL|nr:NADH dehydrogenase subunit 5 [Iphisa elegans]QKK36724.1 NADH dehydrogenase subunit 5 [Iphisa elegans]